MTWELITTWWAHFGHQGELWLLQARDVNDQLVGLGPLMLTEHRPVRAVCWRQLQFIGASENFDHLDLIIKQGIENEVVLAFLELLLRERARWDVLSLSSVPPYSPNLAPLRASGLPWEEEETSICPVIYLPQDWETFFSSLGKSKRKRLRRYRRRLDDQYPDQWAWQKVENTVEVTEAMNEMIRLHQAKWREIGLPGSFADPTVVAFHHAVSQLLLEKGWLWLYRLYIAEEVATVEYAYQYRGRVYSFSSGMNFDLADFSPGQVLTEIMIRSAIESGCSEYDFLRGDEQYKFLWKAEARVDVTLSWAASPRARLEQRVIALTRTGWERLKQILPVAWRRQFVRFLTGRNPDY